MGGVEAQNSSIITLPRIWHTVWCTTSHSLCVPLSLSLPSIALPIFGGAVAPQPSRFLHLCRVAQEENDAYIHYGG